MREDLQPPHELITDRLRLRRPQPADAPAIFERWAQDPEVTRYLVWSPHSDLGESEDHIRRCIEGWTRRTEFVWMIEDRVSGELLGSLAARNQAHGINVGYLMARAAWGHGFMPEALTAITDWFLAQPGVERVWATCDVANTASARTLEKADFQFEGILRRWDVHPNVHSERRDARCYSRIAPSGPVSADEVDG